MDYVLVARVGGGKRKFTPVIGIFPRASLRRLPGAVFLPFGQNSVAVCFECIGLAHLFLNVVWPIC